MYQILLYNNQDALVCVLSKRLLYRSSLYRCDSRVSQTRQSSEHFPAYIRSGLYSYCPSQRAGVCRTKSERLTKDLGYKCPGSRGTSVQVWPNKSDRPVSKQVAGLDSRPSKCCHGWRAGVLRPKSFRLTQHRRVGVLYPKGFLRIQHPDHECPTHQVTCVIGIWINCTKGCEAIMCTAWPRNSRTLCKLHRHVASPNNVMCCIRRIRLKHLALAHAAANVHSQWYSASLT